MALSFALAFTAPPLALQAQAFAVEEATVADVHAAFESGDLTCEGLVGAYLARIDAYDRHGPRLNAIGALRDPGAEAATNAERHADVNEATVTLKSAGYVVIAEIRDEGWGFEFDGHTGLTSMHERAALVGGGITVDTAPGRGTTIRVTVPAVGPDDARGLDRW